MKTIWMINHYAHPYEGRHYKLAEQLVKRGYRVKIICSSTSNPSVTFSENETRVTENINNISFSFIKARDYVGNGKDRMKNIAEFAYRAYRNERKEKQEKPDVIYASSVHPLSWVVGYFLARKFKAKLIIETRDLWPETLIRMGRITETSIVAKVLYKLETFMYEKADHLIFTMPGGKKYLEERNINYKVETNINNGVDLKEFNENLRNYTYELETNPNSFNIVYTGSMGIANALNHILEAAKRLQEQGHNNVHFHFFGDGYKKGELEQFTKSHHLKNVTFYGRVEKKYIPSILSQADVNIATSQNLSIYNYGISLNKLFDYFAAGKPVLSNIPTPFNKIETYGCGITVEPDSAEALVQGITHLSELSKEEYHRYCQNCLKTAEKFDFTHLADQLETIIEQL